MISRIVRFFFGGKQAVLSILVLLVGGVAGWQSVLHWWSTGYSSGTRTGLLRKVSLKGTPLCRYVSVEMVPYGSVGVGAATDAFEFTLDDSREEAPLYKQLQDSERRGKPVTIAYRQDLHKWPWRSCVTTNHFATAIHVEDPAVPAAPATSTPQVGALPGSPPGVGAAPTGAGFPSVPTGAATTPVSAPDKTVATENSSTKNRNGKRTILA